MKLKLSIEFEGTVEDIRKIMTFEGNTPQEIVAKLNRDASEDMPHLLSSTETSFSRIGGDNVIMRISASEVGE